MAVVSRLFYLCLLAVLVVPSCGNSSAADVSTSVKLTGVEIFETNCSMCHGRYGNAGISGASDLTISSVSFEDAVGIVTEGKGAMQAYGEQLSKKQIEAVVEYAFTLRK